MNVVCLDVDSLRPDHIGAYGYEQPTTPNIDELANEAVRFRNVYAANTPCLPSRAALLTGRHGIHNGVATHGPSALTVNSPKSWKQWYACWPEEWARSGREWLSETKGASGDWLTLPELFFHDRVATGAVSSFPRHPAPWFYHLWHEYHHPQEPIGPAEYMQTVRAEAVADLAIEFVRKHADDGFFLYTQFWDPHAPYNRTEEQTERFRDGSLPTYPTAEQIASHQDWDAWRCASQLGIENRADLAALIAEYDAEIRYVDRHIGRIVRVLRELDCYDETMIVVTADHGEEFGEHGVYREHWSTHDGTQRIPLIIKPPESQSTEFGSRDELITNVDIAPTLADYAGLNPPAEWQGRSLRPTIEGTDTSWRDALVLDHGLYTAQRAVRTDRWKFVRTYHPGLWEGVTPDRQLFDMGTDRNEQDDVADGHPDVVTELEEKMVMWAETHVSREEDALHAVARCGPAGYNGQEHRWEGV